MSLFKNTKQELSGPVQLKPFGDRLGRADGMVVVGNQPNVQTFLYRIEQRGRKVVLFTLVEEKVLATTGLKRHLADSIAVLLMKSGIIINTRETTDNEDEKEE